MASLESPVSSADYDLSGMSPVYCVRDLPGSYPGGDLYIRVLTVPAGQSPPANAMAADDIIKFVGARVKRNADETGLASIAAAAFN
jgi:hypothetical protein